MLRLSSIILTIIIAILSDEAAASILFNHRTNKAVSTAFRRTTNHCISRSDPTMVDRRRRHPWKDMNDCSINIWNFRTISNVQVPAPSYHRHRCLAAAAVGAATTSGQPRTIRRPSPKTLNQTNDQNGVLFHQSTTQKIFPLLIRNFGNILARASEAGFLILSEGVVKT